MSDIVERLREMKSWMEQHAPSDVGTVLAAASRIEELEARLETSHAYSLIDGVMTKVAVEPGSIPDGIECRDETIRLQDRRDKAQRARIEELENALRQLTDIAEHTAHDLNTGMMDRCIEVARKALETP